jgi:flagellar hook-associated protein 3 FlgL
MSVYRVSTANTYDRALFNIQQRQAQLGNSQDQLSAGKRVLRASDDAVAATLSERTQNKLLRTEADQRGLEASRRSLQQAESTLGNVSDLYNRVKELIVQGGNATLNASDKKTIAHELMGIREQLVGFSNQKDTAGKPMFAGLGPASASGDPFVETFTNPSTNQTTYGPDGKAVNWSGQRGQAAATETSLPAVIDGYSVFKGTSISTVSAVVERTAGATQAVSVSVTDSASLNTSVFDASSDALGGTQGSYTVGYTSVTNDYLVTPLDAAGVAVAPGAFSVSPTIVGTDIELNFEGMKVQLSGTPAVGDTFTIKPAVDRDIWETLDRAIGALDRGKTGYDLTQELAVVHDQLAIRQDQLLAARGKLGDWLNRADSMQALFSDRAVAYEKENSELVDLDMVAGISNFQKNQTAYQAALQSYSQVQKMSMFDYMR